jgi:hypothetical protein
MTITTVAHSLDPSQHQILVNLGNRYVVFGSARALPQPLDFDPETDSEVLPRVADESEAARSRIVQTLRISGLKSAVAAEATGADVELTDSEGNSVLVDINIRERDPKQRDIMSGAERMKDARGRGENLQIWYVNLERLKLWVMHLDQSRMQIDELDPLDVWEKTEHGVYNRSSVVSEVRDWECRVSSLYDNVEAWLSDRSDLRHERTRSVVMSEDPMRQYAIADRDIPVLDILRDDYVMASFVPRGLWMIGSWGRLDIITPDRTCMLSALRKADKQLEWRLFYPDKRRLPGEPFNKENLLALLGLA